MGRTGWNAPGGRVRPLGWLLFVMSAWDTITPQNGNDSFFQALTIIATS